MAGPTRGFSPESPRWARPVAAVLPGPSRAEKIWGTGSLSLAVLMFIQIASADAQVLRGAGGRLVAFTEGVSDPLAAARSDIEPGSRGHGPG